jgi:glycosyltransferase involved in cell wall biosynthesis
VAYVGQARVRVCHDVVVLHRICTTLEGRWFASAARACGATLVYSTDDLVFDRARLAGDPEAPRRYVACAPLHRAMLDQADAAIVSTEYLREQVRHVAPTKPLFLLRNFLSPDLLALSEAARRRAAAEKDGRGGVTLGYLSGSTTHDRDLASVSPVLRRVLETNPDVRLLLVGPIRTPAELETPTLVGRVEHHPFVSWRVLPDLLARRLDVNLAPLAPERDFNRAKSEVKLLEAAAAGVPTVASRSAGFAEVAGSMPALYAADPAEWEAHLQRMVRHAEGRRELGRAGQEALARFGTAGAATGAVLAAFERMAALRRGMALDLRARPQWVNWPVAPRYTVRDAVYRTASRLHRLAGRV